MWLFAGPDGRGPLVPKDAYVAENLFEPFHRWAASLGVGVQVLGSYLASSSFADDVGLLAPSPDTRLTPAVVSRLTPAVVSAFPPPAASGADQGLVLQASKWPLNYLAA